MFVIKSIYKSDLQFGLDWRCKPPDEAIIVSLFETVIFIVLHSNYLWYCHLEIKIFSPFHKHSFKKLQMKLKIDIPMLSVNLLIKLWARYKVGYHFAIRTSVWWRILEFYRIFQFEIVVLWVYQYWQPTPHYFIKDIRSDIMRKTSTKWKVRVNLIELFRWFFFISIN